MPNIVNEALMEEIERDVREMGSCLIVSFDNLTVAQVQDLRNQFREVGVKYRVIKNRLFPAITKHPTELDLQA